MKHSATEPSSVRSACQLFQSSISGIPRQDTTISDCEISNLITEFGIGGENKFELIHIGFHLKRKQMTSRSVGYNLVSF